MTASHSTQTYASSVKLSPTEVQIVKKNITREKKFEIFIEAE